MTGAGQQPAGAGQEREARRWVRAAMAASGATSGAFFELIEGSGGKAGRLRGVAVEGLFPPPAVPTPVELSGLSTRARRVEWAFRSQEISVETGGAIGRAAQGGDGELVAAAGAAAHPNPAQLIDPIFAVTSLIAVPLRVNGRCVGVVAVANPESGGGFAEEDLAAVRQAVAAAGGGA